MFKNIDCDTLQYVNVIVYNNINEHQQILLDQRNILKKTQNTELYKSVNQYTLHFAPFFTLNSTSDTVV